MSQDEHILHVGSFPVVPPARRKFLCSPTDLEGFKRRVGSLFDRFRIVCPTVQKAFCMGQLRRYEEEMWSYRLVIDEYSREAINQFEKTSDLIDFHYALHHMVFQMWWAHKHGVIRLPNERYKFFAKATEDCYVDEELKAA